MITPDQVRPPGALPDLDLDLHEHDMDTLERLCDDAIRKADRDQRWPACVPKIREPIGDAALRATAAKYGRAGWRVELRAGSDVIMTIDRTVTK